MKYVDSTNPRAQFDPVAKEAELRSDADSWDTGKIEDARDGDIPVIDLQAYFSNPDTQSLEAAAAQLRSACETVGFFSIVGHQVPEALVAAMFTRAQDFLALPIDTKQALAMDRLDWPVGGVGYLPVKHRKLPARDKGNLNEAFIVKRDHGLTLNDNQWPDEDTLPGSGTRLRATRRRSKRWANACCRSSHAPWKCRPNSSTRLSYRLCTACA